ncbi:hypothetical protein HPB49_000945 [Dermacentor silvarum]|uniref:Uncharacterized protein n=1 Tax=Dermacentor silvarum TaxID=543639 RepID=A0ACB8DSQ7_DERSI|nr:hypothetical protein HPB49_000945 [Dermacentor silvarum]
MEQLRTKRGFVRRAITKAISTIDALLSDEATPVRVLHQHLELVLVKQAELVEFDRAIQETLKDADLEADLATAFEYEQKKTSPMQQVKHLMTFLRIQAEAREEGALDQASSSASQRLHPRESRPLELNPPSAAALLIEVRTPYTRPCLLGNASDHTVQECSTSLTLEAKRRKLQGRRRCFRCAKRNHVATECRSARNLQCSHCAGQHLTSLCNVCTVTENEAKRLGSASLSVQRASGPESIGTPPRVTSVSASGTGVMSILLRLLLDTGSQRTFIRRDVARALNCPVQGVERLTIFTFAQHSTNETTIDALEVPEISAVTSPPADSAIITMMTHHGLVPVDARSEAKTFREDEISILIGSDFYWVVVTGQTSR